MNWEIWEGWKIQARNSSLDDELKDDSSFLSVEFESWNDSSWNSKSSVELNSSPSLLQSKNSLNQCWWRIMETDSVGDKFETVMPNFLYRKSHQHNVITNITFSQKWDRKSRLGKIPIHTWLLQLVIEQANANGDEDHDKSNPVIITVFHILNSLFQFSENSDSYLDTKTKKLKFYSWVQKSYNPKIEIIRHS